MNSFTSPDASVVDLTQQPYFRRSELPPRAATDSAESPLMNVEVDQIRTYDRNPRRAHNDSRGPLKESIRAIGLQQALSITRRPGDEFYIVSAGCNTRLQLVQELWRETQDERFRKVPCLFRPWNGEANVMIAHLAENDLRGPLIFIDRALAIEDLRLQIQDETGSDDLRNADLERMMSERGYHISLGMIGKYQYAVNVLYPAIPTILESGMGRPQVERVRALQRAYHTVWNSLDLGPDEAAEAIFIEVLARMDQDEILDLDALRLNLCDELVVTSDLDSNRIRLGFSAALDGRPIGDLRDNLGADTGQTPGQTQEASMEPPPTSPSGGSLTNHSEIPAATGAATTPTPSIAPTKKDAGAQHASAPSADEVGGHSQSMDQEPTDPGGINSSDLQTLRHQALQLATKIASQTGIGDIVIPLPEAGLGFLAGPPEEPLGAGFDENQLIRFIASWWSLAVLSEQFAGHGAAARYIPEEWHHRPIGEAMRQAQDFREWSEANRIPEVVTEIPIIGIPDMASAFVGFPDSIWQNWLQLAACCRAIHQACAGDPWAQG